MSQLEGKVHCKISHGSSLHSRLPQNLSLPPSEALKSALHCWGKQGKEGLELSSQVVLDLVYANARHRLGSSEREEHRF